MDADRFARDQQVLRLAAWREPQGRAAAVCARRGDWAAGARTVSAFAGMGAGDSRRRAGRRASAEGRGQTAQVRNRISTRPRVALAGCACDEQQLGRPRVAHRVGPADSRQRSTSCDRDAIGVVGSARRRRKTLNVAGVTIPGIPFVVIGHNARIGWGLTNAGADVQDFFVEQLDPSRQHYRVGEEWVPLEVRRHEIRVSGREDAAGLRGALDATWSRPAIQTTGTRSMPAIAPPPAQLGETVLALKWHPVLEGNAAAAFDRLARAASWHGVRRRGSPLLGARAELRVCGRRRQYRLRDVRAPAGSRRFGRCAAGFRRAARRRLARVGRHQVGFRLC